jgi:hypothetical protein
MLTIENACLVIVDVQEKLLPVMANPEQVVKNTAVLIQIAQALDIPILWCQQVPKALGPTVGELSSLLDGAEPTDKSTFSCCGDDAFMKQRFPDGDGPHSARLVRPCRVRRDILANSGKQSHRYQAHGQRRGRDYLYRNAVVRTPTRCQTPQIP